MKKSLLIFCLLFGYSFAYDCKVNQKAFIVLSQGAITVIAIDKIETVSATSFRGEMSVTTMSGKKRDFICKNIKEVINKIKEQIAK
jgi:uncharacterized protein YlzI (FlbEa/FlbD family)